ncbi:MAG: MFS transporter [Acidimicrobiia bacterium]|nr:MFS transporter [Acidimicrobiia bacterium]
MDGDRPIESRSDARALRSVAVQFFVNGVVFSSFIPRLPEIRTEIGVSLGGLGLLLTLGSLGGLVGSALCGRLIERFGSRTVLVLAAAGMVVTLPVIGFASAPGVFLAALLLLQMFDVLTDVSMNLQGSWLSRRRHTPVINRLHGLWSVGTVAGGALATVAAGAVSLRAHLSVVALVLVVAVAALAPGLVAGDLGSDEPTPATERAPLVRAGFFAALALMAAAVEIVPSDWAALRLAEDFDLEPSRAGLGFVAFTMGMVAGRFGGDAATVRLGPRTVLRAAAATSALGGVLATLVPWATVSIVGFAVAGLGASVVFPGLYDRAAREPGRPGAMLGALTAGIRVGLLALPVTVGTLAGTAALSVGGAMAVVIVPAAVGLLVLANSSGRADPAGGATVAVSESGERL